MNRTHIALLFAIFFSVTALCAQSYHLTLDVVGMKEKKGNLPAGMYLARTPQGVVRFSKR